MSVRYENARVEISGHGRLRVSLRVVNDSTLHWRGAALGWQVTERESHRYLEDGPSVELRGTLAPGESRECAIEGALPAFAGYYRLFVSPLTPDLGWLHTSGARAIVVDVDVDGAGAALLQKGGWSIAELARRDLTSEPREMLAAVWANRGLAWTLARRDLAARFRGSLGDALWTGLHPLLLMLAYLFVFGVVLRARFAGDPSTAGFALYFLAGMVPWLAFSETVGRAPSALVEHRHFVKKLVFPVELLNVVHTLAALATQMVGLALLCALIFVLRGGVPAMALLLPVFLAPQVLLTLALSWTLSALGVYLRDLGQIIGFLLTLLFFLTPICYPEQSLPPGLDVYFRKNPFYVIAGGWRAVLLQGPMPTLRSILLLYAISIAAVYASALLYRKLRPTFADVL